MHLDIIIGTVYGLLSGTEDNYCAGFEVEGVELVENMGIVLVNLKLEVTPTERPTASVSSTSNSLLNSDIGVDGFFECKLRLGWGPWRLSE
jgi:hypothetical protein